MSECLASENGSTILVSSSWSSWSFDVCMHMRHTASTKERHDGSTQSNHCVRGKLEVMSTGQQSVSKAKHCFKLEWKSVPVRQVPCQLSNCCMLVDDGVWCYCTVHVVPWQIVLARIGADVLPFMQSWVLTYRLCLCCNAETILASTEAFS